ncbi:hypothetical protein FRC11_012167 [Ceratobasidium sp. 423]|nr:hypothetical protein FRC11_012167 [Ceratobasidium sp. 423]
MPKPCQHFDLMGGTGTGGLLAILLGKLRLPIDEAIRCYLDIMSRVFAQRGIIPRDRELDLERVVEDMLGRYCNNTEVLMIDEDGATGSCKVIVYMIPSAAIQVGTPECMRSYRVRENQGPEGSVLEAIRATTATPGVMKRKTVYDGLIEVPYMSATLGWNNPAGLLLVEAARAYPDRPAACLLSLGAGQQDPLNLNQNSRVRELLSSQMISATLAILKDCERTHEELSRRFSHTDNVYFRFNPKQGVRAIEEYDLSRVSEVHVHTRSYLQETTNNRRLNDALEAILARKGGVMLLNGNIIVIRQNLQPIGRCPPPSLSFTGREDILESLREYFFDHHRDRHIYVLYGLGGAGKTQIALAFIHRHKKLFWDVFLIDATSCDTVSTGLKQLAQRANAGSTVEDTLDWLVSREHRWLIVFNNADDPHLDLHDYFPDCSHGDILITSRNRDMVLHTSDPSSCCRIGEMNITDAHALLLKTSGICASVQTKASIDTLIQKLGLHALAITQAGAYMRTTNCSVDEYLDLFSSSQDRLMRFRPRAQSDGYKLTVYATWDVTYPRLMSGAAQLLGVMSFMHHDGISTRFFKTAVSRFPQFEPEIPLTTAESLNRSTVQGFLGLFARSDLSWNALGWQELVSNLQSFSMIDYDSTSETYTIHPLVHAWCRNFAQDTKALVECAAWVISLCVNWKYTSEDYAFRRLLLPHATSLLKASQSITPTLAVELALIFYEASHLAMAEKLCAYTLNVSKVRLGSANAKTLMRTYHLAATYQKQGRWKDASDLLHEVVTVRRRLLGDEHPDTLTCIHTLASTYESQGQYDQAEKLLVEVVEVSNRVLGEEHPDTMTSIHNLASIYESQGDWKKAGVLLLGVIKTRTAILGKNHPDTLASTYTLASVYESQGLWEQAETMLLKVVETAKSEFGPVHTHTLTSMHALASVYKNQNLLEQAKALLIKVVEVSKQVLGKEHPDTLSSVSLLASTYACQGRLKDAEELQLYEMETSKRVLGPRHPDTLTSMHNLAEIYRNSDRLPAAAKLMKEVVSLSTEALGAQHPTTLDSMGVLADIDECLRDLGSPRSREVGQAS